MQQAHYDFFLSGASAQEQSTFLRACVVLIWRKRQKIQFLTMCQFLIRRFIQQFSWKLYHLIKAGSEEKTECYVMSKKHLMLRNVKLWYQWVYFIFLSTMLVCFLGNYFNCFHMYFLLIFFLNFLGSSKMWKTRSLRPKKKRYHRHREGKNQEAFREDWNLAFIAQANHTFKEDCSQDVINAFFMAILDYASNLWYWGEH